MVALSSIPLIGGFVRRSHAAIDNRVRDALEPRDGELQRRLRDTDHRVAELEHRLHGIGELVESLNQAIQRLSPHINALEVRLADRELADRLAALPAEHRDAVAVLEDQHRRIAARLTAVSHYEERLRRLELPAAD